MYNFSAQVIFLLKVWAAALLKDEESQPWGFQQKQYLEVIVGPQFG